MTFEDFFAQAHLNPHELAKGRAMEKILRT
jgi:hypothetical protein